MFAITALELVVVAVICGLVIWPFWKIFTKAGFCGWLSLTQVIPIVNLLVLFYVAFAQWPAYRTPLQPPRTGETHDL
jgi:hypothetical protein